MNLIKNQINQVFLYLQINKSEFTVDDIYTKFKGNTPKKEFGVLEVYELFNIRIQKLIGRDLKEVTYKKYIESQTNNEEVKNARSAYRDYLATVGKDVASLAGKGTGVSSHIVKGQQERMKNLADPELNRLKGNISDSLASQANIVNAMKTGVDMESNLLKFGQEDFTNKNTLATQDRLNNPDFSIGEGQVHYTWDSKTGTYKKITGPAKTYKPSTTSNTTVDKALINRGMTTTTFKAMTPEEQADWIRLKGANPADFGL